MSIRNLVACVLLAVVAVALPAPAAAQESSRERVQFALDLTDRRIEQAEALAMGSDDARVRAELDRAVSLQADAKRAFQGSQLAFANRLTLEARGHADRAIAILKGPDPDGVLAQLERTRDLLERARDRVEECEHTRARALMRTALDMQARADDAARDGRYLAALQLSIGARERARRALRMCNVEENLRDGAERALRRSDQVIQRAHETLDDGAPPAALDALGRAREFQDRATREFLAERWEVCLRLTQTARMFAHRAMRLAAVRP
uniref:DUF4398 domain-containing protein n=1 Tax=Eiseniibacteriota bacterium TaxID=2212470 RepID=A0A832I451_UNCEI